jgi:hypothetical protein
VSYTLEGEDVLEIDHRTGDQDETIELKPGKTITRDWVPVQPITARPTQPKGREPKTVDK